MASGRTPPIGATGGVGGRWVVPRSPAKSRRGGGSGGGGDLAEEVQSILLGTSAEARVAWRDLCQRDGGGIFEPSRHSADFLRHFLKLAGRSERPQGRGKARGSGGKAGGRGRAPLSGKGGGRAKGKSGGEPRNRGLLNKVRDVQTFSEEWQERWNTYCDEAGGRRDPRLHTEAFLEEFIRVAIEEGFEESNFDKKRELVDRVFQAQRSSKACIDLWEKCCDESPKGYRDPRKHDIKYLEWFLELAVTELGENFGGDGGATGDSVEDREYGSEDEAEHDFKDEGEDFEETEENHRDDPHELEEKEEAKKEDAPKPRNLPPPPPPPANLTTKGKKRRTEADAEEGNNEGAGPRRRVKTKTHAARTPEDPSVDDALLEEVRGVRRRGPAWQSFWNKFCDIHSGGRRDPLVQSRSLLEQFLVEAEDFNPGSGEVQGTTPSQEILEEVRLVQAKSPELNDLWRRLCSESRTPEDPEAQTLEFLQHYIDTAAETTEPVEELSARVHTMQRSSAQWKKFWDNFCQNFGNNVRDPRRHEAHFLQRFLNMCQEPNGVVSRRSAMGSAGASRQRTSVASGSNFGPDDAQRLLSDVNQAKKASPDTQKFWNDFCDDLGGGMRDPKRHPPEFLADFLAHMQRSSHGAPDSRGAGHSARESRSRLPAVPLPPPPGVPSELLNIVLECKRKPHAAALWDELCDVHRDGVRDARRLDEGFLHWFLEKAEWEEHLQLERNSSGTRTADTRGGGGQGRGKATKAAMPRVSGSGKGTARKGGGEGAPSVELLSYAKDIHKYSEKWQQFWNDFCDEHGRGLRDPSRHSAQFLEDFVQAAEDSGFQAPWVGVPQELVDEVRAVQRSGGEAKAFWEQCCDEHREGRRDPRKHDAGFLQWFLDEVKEVLGQTPRGDSRRPQDQQQRRSDPKPRSYGARAPAAARVREHGEDERRRHLLNEVRTVQRSSPEWAQFWNHFCDTNGGGVRDPRRHPDNFLEFFLSESAASGQPRSGQLPPPPPPPRGEKRRRDGGSYSAYGGGGHADEEVL